MSNTYIDRETFKKTLSLAGTSFGDDDIDLALEVASEAIDEACSTRFWLPDDSNDEVRVYTPGRPLTCQIDQAAAVTGVAVDFDGDGDYETDWTEGTEFVLLPLNNDQLGKPFDRIRVRQGHARLLPFGQMAAVEVTGRFGWTSAPRSIVGATGLLAHRLLKRAREAPFAIAALGPDVSARIVRTDPDVAGLIAPFIVEEFVG